MPNQYCRYCSHAEDYNGEGEDFVCFAEAPCGGSGNGIFYSAKKAKSVNHCRHYAFCGTSNVKRNATERKKWS